jgi:hypothetical protein
LRDFAGDLAEAKAKVLYAVQQPFHKALLTGRTSQAAWRSKPSFCAVSTEERTINLDLERFMAIRMGAKTIEVNASHLSLISHADVITNLILEAAPAPPVLQNWAPTALRIIDAICLRDHWRLTIEHGRGGERSSGRC